MDIYHDYKYTLQMMRIGIANVRDIDNYLLKFLSLDCLINIIQINKYTHDIVAGSRIYQQYSELKTVNKIERLKYIIKKDYIKIIKRYNLDRTKGNKKYITIFA